MGSPGLLRAPEGLAERLPGVRAREALGLLLLGVVHGMVGCW